MLVPNRHYRGQEQGLIRQDSFSDAGFEKYRNKTPADIESSVNNFYSRFLARPAFARPGINTGLWVPEV